MEQFPRLDDFEKSGHLRPLTLPCGLWRKASGGDKKVKMMCGLQSKSSVYTYLTLRRGGYSPSDPVRTGIPDHYSFLLDDDKSGLSLALCQCSMKCRVAW